MARWSRLGLRYQARWPLQLIFTPEVIAKYNVLFRFLLLLKRVQLELQRQWAAQSQWAQNRRLMPVWVLRSRMAFFTDTLQYFIQLDVLDLQFHRLCDAIRGSDGHGGSRDFEQIRAAHEAYLGALLSQCFLSTPMVGGIVRHILELCLQFCQATVCLGPKIGWWW
ncbi:putative Gamma-tubulin complex component 4 [Paratrimastix pyriformis]|uniref:Gamma-tubulin complex component 4 n=1 Tax=Paratrimastix pyriformis TaxID=342808 RepID=A0ABQ8U4C7_9EUKA|nr:putative Gamma-tubulin complex component 4 [Paratrimastix pyriformis]